MSFTVNRTGDAKIDQVQEDIARAFRDLGAPLDSASIVEGVTLTTASTLVPHRLGRKVRGWIVVRKNASAEVYEGTPVAMTPTKTINLKASATVTVSLLFF